MATPITWQNVNGPSLAEASRPLDSAARAFDMGFGALNNVLAQRNKIDEQNHLTGRANNTAAYLDNVAGYTDVDKLREAQQAGGALSQLRASLGPNIDNNAIRGAADARLVGLMTQQRQSIEFDNMLKDERSMPFMQAYKTASLRGDKAAMAAAEAGYTQAGGRDLAGLVSYNDNRLQQLTERERASDKHRWDGESHRDGLATSAVNRQTALGQLEVSRGNLAVNQRNATIQEAEAMARQQERLENRMAKLREEKADTFSMQASSAKGTATVMKAISELEDDNDRKQARLAFARALKENPNATTESALRATLGMDTAWYTPDSMDRQGFVNTVASGVPNAEEAQAATARRQAVDASMNAIREQLNSISRPSTGGVASTMANPIQGDAAAQDYAAIRAGTYEPSPDMQAKVDAGVRAFQAGNAITPASGRSYGEQLSFNQAQEQRRNAARIRTEAARREFKAEEREKAQRALPVLEARVEALSKVTDNNPNKAPLLKRAEAERDRLKALLK